jgi:hypothetical protein
MAIAAENESVAKLLPASLLDAMPTIKAIDFSDQENSFVCINPDTIFVTTIKIDKSDPIYNTPVVNKENILKHTKGKLSKDKQKYGNIQNRFGDSSITKKFRIFVDTNFVKFDIPDFAFDASVMIEIGKLDSLVKLSMKNFNFNFDFDTLPHAKDFAFDVQIDSNGILGKDKVLDFKFDSTGSMNFDFNFPSFGGKDSDSTHFKIVIPEGLEKLPGLEGLGGLDSLMIFKHDGKDSTFNFNIPFNNSDGGMQQFQQDMKKFQEEMNKFRDEMKKNKPKGKKEKKPFEV